MSLRVEITNLRKTGPGSVGADVKASEAAVGEVRFRFGKDPWGAWKSVQLTTAYQTVTEGHTKSGPTLVEAEVRSGSAKDETQALLDL